ncbi:Siroheme synthase [Propionicimonas sp. T2.31MG-18]|uniref:CbiX/SirB N-terminal domain-containing protein n=1 Tax=Propionicimonas sp. T2.31MG-18 TaxID=3157620 RepID=UPI0035E916C4
MTPTTAPPLVIAGHGTRDAAGVAECHALVARVRGLLPGVRVEAGFVELTPPTIDQALSSVLDGDGAGAVVVPLMIGSGGHVREDIPAAIEAGRRDHRGATVVYTRHLGAPAGLVAAARQRIDSARGDWAAHEVSVVFVGRGCSVTDANADHTRLGRVLLETGGYASLLPAFIQVAGPSVAEALDTAHATGSRRIVVMPHYLFPGRLSTWVQQAVDAWTAIHPDTSVRVAGVIGACPELADVVAQRYREGMLTARTDLGSPAYLTGLLLAGRKVVAIGGGCVNRRRIPKLLAAGAHVTVVAPDLHPALAQLVDDGVIEWHNRGYLASDLDGAWYVLAATDDPELNAQVAAAAEARHTFCVRADRAELGSAWTPATAELEGATIAVLADHDPRRSRALRDRMLQFVRDDA